MNLTLYFRIMLVIAFFATLSACQVDGTEPQVVFVPPTPVTPLANVTIPVKFSDVPVGTQTKLKVTVTSAGNTSVSIRVLPTPPEPFSIINDNCSSKFLSPAFDCTFDVQFSPTTTGPFQYSFDVPTDGKNRLTVNVSGNGTSNAPLAPTDVSAAPGDARVTIKWKNVPGATSYNLYWQTTSIANKTQIKNVTSPYVHLGLTNGTGYRYFVKAENANGESADSLTVMATPLAGTIFKEPTIFKIHFDDLQEGLTSDSNVEFSRKGLTNVNIGQLPTLPAPFSIVNDTCSLKYVGILSPCSFAVRFAPTTIGTFAHNFDFPSDGVNKFVVNITGASIAKKPSAPTGVSAKPGDAQVTISWNTVPDATRYILSWRSGTNTLPNILLNVTSPYVHGGLTNGTEYRYVVTAENASGKSADSTEVKAIPTAPRVSWNTKTLLGTAYEDSAAGIAVDADNNVYLAGKTLGQFGDSVYQGGNGDAFVAKYDSIGKKLWTREFGTAGLDRALGVAVDGAKNVYVVGQTYGNLDGNSFAGGDGDAFVVKFNSAGERQWTKSIGTTGGDSAFAVVVDNKGDVIVGGIAGGSLRELVYKGGTSDAFLVKLSSAGEEKWIREFGAGGEDGILGVTADSAGEIYVAGYTSGAFHDATFVGGVSDGFVEKYDEAGTRIWTDTFGASAGVFRESNTDIALSVAVDVSGDVYVGGSTTGSLSSDISEDNRSLGTSGDGVLLKYSAAGKRQWIRQFGGGLTDYARAVAVDTLGGVYVTGSTQSGLGGNQSSGFADIFLMKYDSNGVRTWTRQAGSGSSYSDFGSCIAVTNSGNVFVAGYTTGGYSTNFTANWDIIVLKYGIDGGG